MISVIQFIQNEVSSSFCSKTFTALWYSSMYPRAVRVNDAIKMSMFMQQVIILSKVFLRWWNNAQLVNMSKYPERKDTILTVTVLVP